MKKDSFMIQRKISSPVLMTILPKVEGVGRKTEHCMTSILRYVGPALTSASGAEETGAVCL